MVAMALGIASLPVRFQQMPIVDFSLAAAWRVMVSAGRTLMNAVDAMFMPVSWLSKG
jgi:hypothetical protein